MSARFKGTYEPSLDDKGRVIVPAKLREKINPEVDGELFVLAPGPEECLFLYTEKEWERICAELEALPKGSPELRQFQRYFHANAVDLEPDRQGRIVIPERLRSLVNMGREIVMAGCHDRIEIWPAEAWKMTQAAARRTYAAQVQMFLGTRSS